MNGRRSHNGAGDKPSAHDRIFDHGGRLPLIDIKRCQISVNHPPAFNCMGNCGKTGVTNTVNISRRSLTRVNRKRQPACLIDQRPRFVRKVWDFLSPKHVL